MNIALLMISNELGMSLENIALLCILFGGLLFYVRGFTFGAMMHFFMFGGLFILMYLFGMNFVPSIVATFIFLIAMCFALYSELKENPYGVA